MGGESDWLEILLFAALVIILGPFAWVSAMEAWRQWSENRRIRSICGSSLACSRQIQLSGRTIPDQATRMTVVTTRPFSPSLTAISA
jgi:hypothetical protein